MQYVTPARISALATLKHAAFLVERRASIKTLRQALYYPLALRHKPLKLTAQ
jgi:hypothetical protein